MAEYSRITIEFLIDFELDYSCSIRTLQGGTFTLQGWDWVATRSNPFEVTVGTPTGTAGETTATNFKAAFDLDNPSGYVTATDSNIIQIDSETLGQDFVGFKASDGSSSLVNGTDYIVTFENYVAPIELITLQSILTRSPHYVTTPFYFDTTTSATIDVKIWNGDINTPPTDPTVSLTKIRPTVDYSEFNTNISELVKSRLDSQLELTLTSDVNLVSPNNNEFKWVDYVASYVDPVEEVTTVTGTFGAANGYGYFEQGINPALISGKTTRYLTSVDNRRIGKNGLIIFPFLNDGYYSQIRALSLPNTEIGLLVNLTTSNDSSNYVQYMMIDVNNLTDDTLIDFDLVINGGGLHRVTYNIIEECEQTPKTVVFKNKFGFFDVVGMFGKVVDKTNIKKSEFINNYVSDGSYDITKHQIKDINVIGNDSFTLSSGFIRENQNTLLKELILSDTVYLWDDINKRLTPVRVTTSTLQYKTRLNDQKVEYNIDFDYAFNTINNI